VSQRGKGTNYVPKLSSIARSISKKEREGKPKNTVSLEESSTEMIAHLKIETACTHTNFN
jgi:hypothetical protein